MHHKRGRRKNARAGCLMCKYHKGNGYKGGLRHQTVQERKSRITEREEVSRAEDWEYDLYYLDY
jgi:hypothetical protein